MRSAVHEPFLAPAAVFCGQSAAVGPSLTRYSNACELDDITVVRAQGDFNRHKHDDTDDFLLVLEGILDVELGDRVVTLKSGRTVCGSRGVEHRPAPRNGEVKILLIEPEGTPNAADARTAAPRTYKKRNRVITHLAFSIP